MATYSSVQKKINQLNSCTEHHYKLESSINHWHLVKYYTCGVYKFIAMDKTIAEIDFACNVLINDKQLRG